MMTTNEINEIQSFQCRHIFTDGHRCGSKALRAEEFCYYHHTTRKPALRQTTSPNCATFEVPFPEDRPSVQVAIGEVLRRLTSNTIDRKRAGLILYALQIASQNLPRLAPSPEAEPAELVDEIETHPTHGPVAPVAEYIAPEDRPQPESPIARLRREVDEEVAAMEAAKLPYLQAAATPDPSSLIPVPCPSDKSRPNPKFRRTLRQNRGRGYKTKLPAQQLIAMQPLRVVPDDGVDDELPDLQVTGHAFQPLPHAVGRADEVAGPLALFGSWASPGLELTEGVFGCGDGRAVALADSYL